MSACSGHVRAPGFQSRAIVNRHMAAEYAHMLGQQRLPLRHSSLGTAACAGLAPMRAALPPSWTAQTMG